MNILTFVYILVSEPWQGALLINQHALPAALPPSIPNKSVDTETSQTPNSILFLPFSSHPQ